MATVECAAEQEVEAYLALVMAGFGPQVLPAHDPSATADTVADAVFDLLTSRTFCHLQRGLSAPYRERTVELLRPRIEAAEPLRFFYDIGPGYHATLRPGEEPLFFDVGLAELLILFNVNAFADRVANIYPPGVHFHLVVDNLCGHRTNDIPLELSEGYCARLRYLIDELGLTSRVTLLVESETFALGEYDQLLATVEPSPLALPSTKAHENVERFLGRLCSADEAAERIEGYRRAGIVTEQLLARAVDGVRITQRATPATLGFRPFPGGDSRSQCGAVVLGANSKGRLRPFLLTSTNVDEHDCAELVYPEVLPESVATVLYASPRS